MGERARHAIHVVAVVRAVAGAGHAFPGAVHAVPRAVPGRRCLTFWKEGKVGRGSDIHIAICWSYV